MNKVSIAFMILGFLAIDQLHAQSVGFNYQAVALDRSKAEGFGRDTEGEVLSSRDIKVRFSIAEGSAEGSMVYQETHETTTDIFGMFRLIVGRGERTMPSTLNDLDWGNIPYFLHLEIALNGEFEYLGAEELLGSPYALNVKNQTLSLEGDELQISGGNSITLVDNDNQNELQTLSMNDNVLSLSQGGGSVELSTGNIATVQELSRTANEITLSNGGGTVSIADDDSNVTNELQDLSLAGTTLNIEDGTGVDLSALLDGTGTDDQTLTLLGNTLSIEDGNNVDLSGLANTDTQDLSTDDTAGDISLTDGGNITINVNDADASTTNELVTNFALNGANLELTDAGGTRQVALADLQGSGTDDQNLSLIGTILNIEDGTGVDLAAIQDGTGTDDQTLFLVGNTLAIEDGNNVDLSSYQNTDTQDLSTDGTAGDISLTDGGNITINVVDDDADAENEIQDLALDATTDILTITNNTSAAEIDLGAYLSPFSRTGTTISNENGTYATDDFIFGSPQMDDDGNEDHDSRMFFDKSNGSFRAGRATGVEWDTRGDYSTAFGFLTAATGIESTTFGYRTLAAGRGSAAIGRNSRAYGEASFAVGSASRTNGLGSFAVGGGTLTNGWYSVAMGREAQADGYSSIAIGDDVRAYSRSEVVLGSYNTTYTPIDDSGWNTDDRLFVIGNGYRNLPSPAVRRDALIMLKNGNTTLNGALTIDADNVGGADGYTFPAQDGADGQVLATDGSGDVTWMNVAGSTGAFAENLGIISNTDLTAESLIFGSSAKSGFIMYYDRTNGAFRAGRTTGTLWSDPVYVGIYSAAFGYNVIASGSYSFAVGNLSRAQGRNSVAMGAQAWARGDHSVAIGLDLRNDAYGSSAFGLFNEEYTELSNNSYVSNDRLFTIGNGNSSFSRSDALVMLKNGNTTLHGTLTIDADNVAGAGTSYTLPGQDGAAGQIITTDGAGVASWSDATANTDTQDLSTDGSAGDITLTDGGTITINVEDADADAENEIQDLSLDGATHTLTITDNASATEIDLSPFLEGVFATSNNITSNENGDYATDDFLFGSPQMDDDGNEDHDSRMFFNKEKGAFRAGIASTDRWDDVNVGEYSVAMGIASISSGFASTAIGSGVTASGFGSVALGSSLNSTGTSSFTSGSFNAATGPYSTVMGSNSGASGSNSFAAGLAVSASGPRSFAFGERTHASGTASTAMGRDTNAIGEYSTAMGYDTRALGDYSMAMGRLTDARSDYSTAIGTSTVASGQYATSMGYQTISSGNYSTAQGNFTRAESFSETTIGSYNTTYTPNSVEGFDDQDRLFVIGNGFHAEFAPSPVRSDALVMLKNGNTTLNGQLTIDADNVDGAGTPYTLPGQDGAAGQVITTDGAGIANWIDPTANTDTQDLSTDGTAGDISLTDGGAITINVNDEDADAENEIQDLSLNETTNILTITDNTAATDIDLSPYMSPFATTDNVTSNENGDYTTDDFIFGSPHMEDDGDAGHDSRMFFDKSKGAFRVGYVNADQWDDGNVGDYSTAFGFITEASGDYSTSIGRDVIASGDYATAQGLATRALSFGEQTVGIYNTSYTPTSAIGYNATDRLFVVGNGTFNPILGVGTPSDALVMLKNGNTTLHGQLTIDADNLGGNDGYTLPGQDGTNGQVLTTDGAGNTSWQEPIIPVGGIIMWSGAIADIPTGWALCDGTGSTPDLSGQFIVSYQAGSADYGTIGARGGQNEQTLTADQLPAHQHELDGAGATTLVSSEAHSHSVTVDAGSNIVEQVDATPGTAVLEGTGFGGGGEILFGTTDPDSHDHILSGNTGGGVGLAGNVIDNRPAYYTLAFIMRL